MVMIASFIVPIVVILLASIGCRAAESREPRPSVAAQTAPASAPKSPPTSPVLDPDVATAVNHVLSSAEHPELRWGKIPDVAAALKSLYDAEPDRLFWFDGTTPVPKLTATLDALAKAGDHGLDPADYDAALLSEQWATFKTGTIAAADRALFDLAVSVAVARIVKAVQVGRVDPATMYWGYDVSTTRVDVAKLLPAARDGDGLAATLDKISPPVTH